MGREWKNVSMRETGRDVQNKQQYLKILVFIDDFGTGHFIGKIYFTKAVASSKISFPFDPSRLPISHHLVLKSDKLIISKQQLLIFLIFYSTSTEPMNKYISCYAVPLASCKLILLLCNSIGSVQIDRFQYAF